MGRTSKHALKHPPTSPNQTWAFASEHELTSPSCRRFAFQPDTAQVFPQEEARRLQNAHVSSWLAHPRTSADKDLLGFRDHTGRREGFIMDLEAQNRACPFFLDLQYLWLLYTCLFRTSVSSLTLFLLHSSFPPHLLNYNRFFFYFYILLHHTHQRLPAYRNVCAYSRTPYQKAGHVHPSPII